MLFSFLMILNVLMLYITQSAIAWASEAVLTIFVFFVWIGISYAFKERKHIRVTALTEFLPVKWRKILEVIVSIMIILFFCLLIKVGIDWMSEPSVQNKTSLLLKYPMWLFYFSAPLGAALSTVRIVQNTFEDIRSLRSE